MNSLAWNLKTKETTDVQRTDWWLPEAKDGGCAKWLKVVKMYKFSAIKKSYSYTIETIVNNTVLHI